MINVKSLESANKLIVFYDGECGFCNQSIHWILKNDKNDRFLFASLQSEYGQKFLAERGLPNQHFDTLYLWQPNQFYLTKYEAILKISTEMGGLYKLAAIGKIVPNVIGNQFYNLVSKNRKKLIKNNCLIPDQAQSKKFIS